jgi:hypothetical protein
MGPFFTEYRRKDHATLAVILASESVPNPHRPGTLFELLTIAALDAEGLPVEVLRVPHGRFHEQWSPTGRVMGRLGRRFYPDAMLSKRGGDADGRDAASKGARPPRATQPTSSKGDTNKAP